MLGTGELHMHAVPGELVPEMAMVDIEKIIILEEHAPRRQMLLAVQHIGARLGRDFMMRVSERDLGHTVLLYLLLTAFRVMHVWYACLS
jgi:hypothetical protein